MKFRLPINLCYTFFVERSSYASCLSRHNNILPFIFKSFSRMSPPNAPRSTVASIVRQTEQLNLEGVSEARDNLPTQESSVNNEQGTVQASNPSVARGNPDGHPQEMDEAPNVPGGDHGGQGVEVTGQPQEINQAPDVAEAVNIGQREVIVNVQGCTHLLSEANYNARDDLGGKLDVNNGIELLAEKLVSLKDWLDIWRCCNGGTYPAMGMISRLAESMVTTLGALREYAVAADQERSVKLVQLIDSNRNAINSRLDKLPFTLLGQLASEMSANPHPIQKQDSPLWKRIAAQAGMTNSEISELNIPANQSQSRSLTMTFIEIVNQRNPSNNIAWLADGLKKVGRIDLLQNEKMFEACRGCCIIIN